MSAYTAAVTVAIAKVEEAEKLFKEAAEKLKIVRALNGQNGYEITIHGVRVSVASMDQRTYMATMNRGCEMIHLGALKVLDAHLDFAKARLFAAREALLAAANQANKS